MLNKLNSSMDIECIQVKNWDNILFYILCILLRNSIWYSYLNKKHRNYLWDNKSICHSGINPDFTVFKANLSVAWASLTSIYYLFEKSKDQQKLKELKWSQLFWNPRFHASIDWFDETSEYFMMGWNILAL